MTIRSWVIKSWPEVLWRPPVDRSQWPVFQHMGTEMRSSPDELGRKIGDTVWVAHLDQDQLIGAAWEWVELLPGVAAIRDPNGFVSNARLLDEQNDALDELQSIVGLNRIAYATAWQNVVAQCVVGGAPRVCHPEELSLLFAGLSAPAGRRVQQLQLPPVHTTTGRQVMARSALSA